MRTADIRLTNFCNFHRLETYRKTVEFVDRKRSRVGRIVRNKPKPTTTSRILFHHDSHAQHVSILTKESVHIKIRKLVRNVEDKQVCSTGSLMHLFRGRSPNWWSRQRRWIMLRHRQLASIWPHMHWWWTHSWMSTWKVSLHVWIRSLLQWRRSTVVHVNGGEVGEVSPWLLMVCELCVDGSSVIVAI